MRALKYSIVVFFVLTAVTIANTEVLHTVELETGKQRHARSIFSFIVSSWTEDDDQECSNWKNPYPESDGKVVLSKCTLLFGCDEKSYEILNQGCNT